MTSTEWGSGWAQCPGSSPAAFQRGCPLVSTRDEELTPPHPGAHPGPMLIPQVWPPSGPPGPPRPPQHGVSAPALPQPLPVHLYPSPSTCPSSSFWGYLYSFPHRPSTTRSVLMGTCRQHQRVYMEPRAVVLMLLEAQMVAVSAPRLKAAFSGLCQRPSS